MASLRRTTRLTAVGAVALVAVLGGCGDAELEASHFDLPAGAALIPPESLDGQAYEGVRLGSRPLVPVSGTVVATRVDGEVVAVVEIPLDDFEADHGSLEEYGSLGPLVSGRATWVADGSGLLHPHALLVPVDGAVVELSSRTLTAQALATVAADVHTPIDRSGAVPGEVIGVLHGEPDGIAAVASYRTREGYTHDVTVFSASRSEQEAYLALAHLDPEQSIDVNTESSCCQPGLLLKARSVSARGIESTIATLTIGSKMLVIPGDPGVVLVSHGQRLDDDVPSDPDLIAIAEGSEVTTVEELAAHVRAWHDQLAGRVTDGLRAGEAALGWDVLEERVVDGIPSVISEGAAPRPEPQSVGITSPAVCLVYESDLQGALRPLPPDMERSAPQSTCVPTTAPNDPIVLGTDQAVGGPLFVGSLREDVARVALEFPEGAIAGEIVEVVTSSGELRLVVIGATMQRQIELTGADLTAGMPLIAFVAYDAAGTELAWLPLFAHLQP